MRHFHLARRKHECFLRATENDLVIFGIRNEFDDPNLLMRLGSSNSLRLRQIDINVYLSQQGYVKTCNVLTYPCYRKIEDSIKSPSRDLIESSILRVVNRRLTTRVKSEI